MALDLNTATQTKQNNWGIKFILQLNFNLRTGNKTGVVWTVKNYRNFKLGGVENLLRRQWRRLDSCLQFDLRLLGLLGQFGLNVVVFALANILTCQKCW